MPGPNHEHDPARHLVPGLAVVGGAAGSPVCGAGQPRRRPARCCAGGPSSCGWQCGDGIPRAPPALGRLAAQPVVALFLHAPSVRGTPACWLPHGGSHHRLPKGPVHPLAARAIERPRLIRKSTSNHCPYAAPWTPVPPWNAAAWWCSCLISGTRTVCPYHSWAACLDLGRLCRNGASPSSAPVRIRTVARPPRNGPRACTAAVLGSARRP